MFDIEKFRSTKFKPRTKPVEVQELAEWFPDREAAVWTVRGLTGLELAQLRTESDRTETVSELVGRLFAEGEAKGKADALLEAMALIRDVPQDFVKRKAALVLGSVSPVCDEETAVRVSNVHPVVFYRLTDAIFALTGQGQMGGSRASGTTPESGPHSPCAPGAPEALSGVEEGSGSCLK